MKLYSDKEKKKRFKEPTPEEVANQFSLKGVTDPLEPQKFYAHYSANGWYVGRSKMKNWRAAVAGWILRMNDFKKPQKDDRFNPDSIKDRLSRW